MSSLIELLNSGDYESLASFCETAELMAPLGITSPEIYGTLLAVYLVQNELDHAKLLWKRIPGSVKTSNPEIPAIWEVGKRLWRREFAEVYPLIEKREWPANIAPILCKLRDNVKQRVIGLVSKAYTTIGFDQLCQLLGSDQQTTLTILKEKDWIVNEQIVYPKHDNNAVILQEQGGIGSQERLTELVDIVSFLEN